jgi:hypothetical protein
LQDEIADQLESTAGRDPHFAGAQDRPGRIVGVPSKELGDLRVRGWLEVLIPHTDRPQPLRLEQADDRGSALHLERRPAASVALNARLDLGAGARGRSLEFLHADE